MTAPAASSNNPTQSPEHANIVPSEVGWQFVPQYYMFVNKQPQKLHCFYTKNSTFIHGTEGEDGKPCLGQQEIHNKILSIGFQDCKVFIHSVDAQSSADSGIIIQVIGEMSNRGEPWRKFAQTFFLAPQKGGYYVLNDIFRFLKEESVEDEESDQTETVPPPAQVAQENTVEPAAPGVQAGHPTVAATPFDAALPNHHLQQQQLDSNTPEANEVVVSMEEKKPTTNGYHAPEPEPEIAPIPHVEPIKQAPVVEPSPAQPPAEVQRPLTPQIAPKPAPSLSPAPSSPAISAAASPAQAPAKSVQTSAAPAQPTTQPPPPSAATVVAAKPAAAAAAQAPGPAASKPAAPKTWANLAAANSNRWGPQVADAKGISAAAPAPAPVAPPPAAPSVPTQPKNEHRGGDKEGRDVHPMYQAALNVSTPQCYIRSVSEAVSHQALFNVLSSRFGPLQLEIVRQKACAFVEFTTLDAARKAIIASLPHNAGGEGGIKVDVEGNGQARIHVETRRERSERTAVRPRPGGQGQGQQGHGQYQNQERGGSGGGSGFRGSGSRGGRGAGRGGGGGGGGKP